MSGVKVNGKTYPLESEETIAKLLERIGFSGRRLIVEQNGEPVLPQDTSKSRVRPGDRLEVVQLVGGG